MNRMKKILAAIAAVCMLLVGCGKKEPDQPAETSAATAAKPDFSVTSVEEPEFPEDDETVSIYTGKEVENEEDLAIFKFNCTPPEGFDTVIDDKEGKQYVSPNGGIVVKAQNFKEEFKPLEVFADSGCASIKIGNMLYQSDTEFSEPIKTTVAGFDAIRYDYTVTSYIFPPVTDANGDFVFDEDGKYVLSEDKEVCGEYVNRVYYFYSDEDVFYFICEAPKENYDAVQDSFDQFVDSISISKK